jgi:hypothetical protein
LDLKHQPYLAAASGIDESLQGISTDPFGRNSPGAIGLRIPPVLPDVAAEDQPRYLFCLASRTLGNAKTTIRGIRQLLTIGVDRSGTDGQELPYELPVTSPSWRFPDGNVSWHLVREPNDDLRTRATAYRSDSTSWRYRDSDQAAMLYESATFAAGAVDPQTGAPIFYNVGLQTYVPPQTFSASHASPIGNLGNMKGIYYPWEPQSDDKLNIVVAGNCRISLYASVLQSNPVTRIKPLGLTASNIISSGISPEDAFVSNFTFGEGGTQGPIYWRIGGSILFDDAFGAD